MPCSSYHNRLIHQFHGDLPQLSPSSYARLFEGPTKKAAHDLEYLGDRFLYLCISPLILSHHPECTGAELERIVGYMTTNCALALLSVSMGLQDSYTMYPAELSWYRNFESHPTAKVPKALANSFEAFCGALAEERGEEEAYSFVESLFEPLIGPAYFDVFVAAPIIARYESERALAEEDSDTS